MQLATQFLTLEDDSARSRALYYSITYSGWTWTDVVTHEGRIHFTALDKRKIVVQCTPDNRDSLGEGENSRLTEIPL